MILNKEDYCCPFCKFGFDCIEIIDTSIEVHKDEPIDLYRRNICNNTNCIANFCEIYTLKNNTLLGFHCEFDDIEIRKFINLEFLFVCNIDEGNYHPGSFVDYFTPAVAKALGNFSKIEIKSWEDMCLKLKKVLMLQ